MADSYRVTYQGETRVIDDPEVIKKLSEDPAFDIQKVNAKTPEEQSNEPGYAESALRGAAKGVTLGFSPDIIAAARWAGENAAKAISDVKLPTKTYDQLRQEARAENARAEEANPKTALAANLVGSLVTPVPGMGKLRALGTLGKIGEGAIIGGLSEYGNSEDRNLTDAAKGAALGGGFSAGTEATLGLARAAGGALKRPLSLIKSKYFPQTEEEKLIGLRAKADVGPSREDIAQTAIKDLDAQQKALETEVKKADDLIAKHGDRVDDALHNDVTKQVYDNINTINVSAERIFEEAHTGLKGNLARQSFASHLARQTEPERARTMTTAFEKASVAINKAEEIVDDIIDSAGKGLVDKPGGAMKELKKAIKTYREKASELRAGSDRFDAMYSGKRFDEPAPVQPETLRGLYVLLDNVKRKIGDTHGGVVGDRVSREKIESLFESYRKLLENSKIWGKEISTAQKEINGLWFNYLKLAPAIDRSLMRPKALRTVASRNTWGTVAEGDMTRIKAITRDPEDIERLADVENLDSWLGVLPQLSKSLTKHYKPTSELQGEVRSIEKAANDIRESLGKATLDARRRKTIGIAPRDQAVETLAVHKTRGLPENDNTKAISDLVEQNKGRSAQIQALSDQASGIRARELEPTASPDLMTERLAADKAYQDLIRRKEESYRDLGRSPSERALRAVAQRGKAGAMTAGRFAGERTGRMAGIAGGKVTGSDSSEYNYDLSTEDKKDATDIAVEDRLGKRGEMKTY